MTSLLDPLVFARLLLTTVLLLLPCSTGAASSVGARSRRSIVTMRNMVRAAIGIEPLRLIGYANWCGYGGGGTILDPIDECCYQHDKCFDRVHELNRCSHLTGYKVTYNWRWKALERALKCTDNPGSCQRDFCECDRVFTECLYARRQHFRPSRYPLPLLVTALYYGTYACWFTPVCWVMGPEFDMLRYAFLVYHLT